MILAYHAIFGAYGFWLPNDPRGSWSDFIRRYELLRFGPATKTSTRRSVAASHHDVHQRLAAKAALKYRAVEFTGIQARAVGRGFAKAIEDSGYTVYACAILPDHVHLVLGRHAHPVERMVGHLKGRATQRLKEEGLHPLAEFAGPGRQPPSPWAQKAGWQVYLNDAEAILRAIRYVEENPLKDGLPAQRWPFVIPW